MLFQKFGDNSGVCTTWKMTFLDSTNLEHLKNQLKKWTVWLALNLSGLILKNIYLFTHFNRTSNQITIFQNKFCLKLFIKNYCQMTFQSCLVERRVWKMSWSLILSRPKFEPRLFSLSNQLWMELSLLLAKYYPRCSLIRAKALIPFLKYLCSWVNKMGGGVSLNSFWIILKLPR